MASSTAALTVPASMVWMNWKTGWKSPQAKKSGWTFVQPDFV
jgi:hypothetical protein